MSVGEDTSAKLTKLHANIKNWRGQVGAIRQSLYGYPADLKPLAGVGGAR
ncbi:hypothetical protein LMG26696_03525 [Achromobacter pulmonis]|nr:hypothetical protein [Achromobacter pulmonis]CAB3664032.1 hypothetical protein LMG26696_03525 [Achromobacter pulmonis]